MELTDEEVARNIRQLAQLHDKLNDIVESVNKCYSVQVK